jgi:phosphate transport system protein
MRDYFHQRLAELRDDILKMGSMVEDELQLALKALDRLDVALANEVFETDETVNEMRFSIEGKCFELIVTQQPAARDLRAIVAVMNMIVDLERMGDQAKGIAKIILRLVEHPHRPQPPELRKMGEMVSKMLNQSMTAYAEKNVDLAQQVADRDDQVDGLYARVYTQIMEAMADTKNQKKIETCYELLRSARELERFGDLTTNVAERVIYIVTGRLHEVNINQENESG